MQRFAPVFILIFLFACADKKHFRSGNAMLKKRSYQQAVNEFDQYVAANPSMPRAYLRRGYASWLTGNTLAAYQDMEKVLQLDSLNTLALCNRGYMRQQLGRTELALADYNKVLSIDKHNADTYLNRAALYYEQGMKDKALHDIAMAMEYGRFTDGNFGCAKGMNYYLRGVSRMSKHEYEGAILYFTSAIAADTLNGRAYYERGLAFKAVNDKKGACSDLNKAKMLGVKVGDDQFPLNCDQR